MTKEREMRGEMAVANLGTVTGVEGRKALESIALGLVDTSASLQKELFNPERMKEYGTDEKIQLYNISFNNMMKVLEFMRKSSLQDLPPEESAIMRSFIALTKDQREAILAIYREQYGNSAS